MCLAYTMRRDDQLMGETVFYPLQTNLEANNLFGVMNGWLCLNDTQCLLRMAVKIKKLAHLLYS